VPGEVGQQLPVSSPYTSVVCSVEQAPWKVAAEKVDPLASCTVYRLACLIGVHWK
jgi:hypothetical protein